MIGVFVTFIASSFIENIQESAFLASSKLESRKEN